tara:strand:- start:7240 stop:8364 length:1125 start_codon:yes stop_codon:yes gene_type:complete
MIKKVPFSKPDIIDKDIEKVVEVIKSGWLAHGKFSEKLEEIFCNFTGAKYATTVSNCTAGLHLSCLAAGFGRNDEVIVPAQTHTATSHAVEYTNAKPVFIDVDPISGNMLFDEVESKITNKTKGIIPVHMAGYPCEMEKYQKLCSDYNLILIEDCAHGIGTKINNKHAGTFGNSGCFSFYPTKQITTGEGGIVISNDKKFIDKIKKLKAFGIDTPPEMRSKPGVYDVQSLGYNYRMTDFQAALGAGQMQRYSTNLELRQKNAYNYSVKLKNKNISFTEYSDDCSYFLFQIIISEEINRDKILFSLMNKNIGVSIHYATPVPLMSYYKNKYGYKSGEFPNAENYANKSISLPVHSNLTYDDILYVCENLFEAMEN